MFAAAQQFMLDLLRKLGEAEQRIRSLEDRVRALEGIIIDRQTQEKRDG